MPAKKRAPVSELLSSARNEPPKKKPAQLPRYNQLTGQPVPHTDKKSQKKKNRDPKQVLDKKTAAHRAAAFEDLVDVFREVIGDKLPHDPFGSEQVPGHIQYWNGLPLIFDCTLDAVHPDCQEDITNWLCNCGNIYEYNNDRPTRTQEQEILWVEALVQIYNAHDSDIFEIDEENPGYKLLKQRAFIMQSPPAIYHLQNLLSTHWHEILADYCNPDCENRPELILQLTHIAEMNVRVDSLFRRTDERRPTFWRPQMEDLAKDRFLSWKKFEQLRMPTGDQDTWTLPTEGGYSVAMEKEAYQMIYRHIQLQKGTYLASFVANDEVTQEEADELRREMEQIPDGPFEDYYHASTNPVTDEPLMVPSLPWRAKAGTFKPPKKRTWIILPGNDNLYLPADAPKGASDNEDERPQPILYEDSDEEPVKTKPRTKPLAKKGLAKKAPKKGLAKKAPRKAPPKKAPAKRAPRKAAVLDDDEEEEDYNFDEPEWSGGKRVSSDASDVDLFKQSEEAPLPDDEEEEETPSDE